MTTFLTIVTFIAAVVAGITFISLLLVAEGMKR